MGTEQYLLQKSKNEGAETKSFAIVENLIMKLGLNDELAADIGEVSIEFVQKVRASLDKKTK